MRRVLVLVVACVGCHAQVSDGEPNPGGPDGSVGIDAGIDGPSASGPDAAHCASSRVVYLNFTGQALTDATTSDAVQNRASWIVDGTAAPAAPATNRSATQIQDITTGIRTALAQVPVTVVTQRPASGEYVMIVYGGVAANVGSRFGAAVQELDCGDLTRNDAAWVSDNLTATQHAINVSLGALGFGIGLTATSDPNDCMCGWDNACTSNDGVQCTLSSNIARDPAANQRCPNLTTQNEVQTFQQAFCQ